ncbi:hypothetical protein [Microtetraspora fusca]|uniref:hypothetical protein n=1 Tax=Microtetraspora fusca TaxID=1997 RepID=UPI001FE1167A|nr:hypothetical protein [Microtetraspora fusca]
MCSTPSCQRRLRCIPANSGQLPRAVRHVGFQHEAHLRPHRLDGDLPVLPEKFADGVAEADDGRVVGGGVTVTTASSRRPYLSLLAEPLRLLRTEPDLRRSCLYQAAVFAGFSAAWTCLALLLTGPDYGLGAETAQGIPQRAPLECEKRAAAQAKDNPADLISPGGRSGSGCRRCRRTPPW